LLIELLLKVKETKEDEIVFSDARASFQWAGETNYRKAAPEKITAFWEAPFIVSASVIQNFIRKNWRIKCWVF